MTFALALHVLRLFFDRGNKNWEREVKEFPGDSLPIGQGMSEMERQLFSHCLYYFDPWFLFYYKNRNFFFFFPLYTCLTKWKLGLCLGTRWNYPKSSLESEIHVWRCRALIWLSVWWNLKPRFDGRMKLDQKRKRYRFSVCKNQFSLSLLFSFSFLPPSFLYPSLVQIAEVNDQIRMRTNSKYYDTKKDSSIKFLWSYSQQ